MLLFMVMDACSTSVKYRSSMFKQAFSLVYITVSSSSPTNIKLSLNTTNASADEIEVISIQVCINMIRDNANNGEFTKYMDQTRSYFHLRRYFGI
jgi:hypothetical protein